MNFKDFINENNSGRLSESSKDIFGIKKRVGVNEKGEHYIIIDSLPLNYGILALQLTFSVNFSDSKAEIDISNKDLDLYEDDNSYEDAIIKNITEREILSKTKKYLSNVKTKQKIISRNLDKFLEDQKLAVYKEFEKELKKIL